MNVYAALISAHQRVLAATGVNCLLARLSLLDSIELRKHPGFHAVRPYPHSMGYVAGIKVLVDDFTASGCVFIIVYLDRLPTLCNTTVWRSISQGMIVAIA